MRLPPKRGFMSNYLKRKGITMAQNKQTNGQSRLFHWVRVVVMCLSFGFIFPHAMTEDDDMDPYVMDKDTNAKK